MPSSEEAGSQGGTSPWEVSCVAFRSEGPDSGSKRRRIRGRGEQQRGREISSSSSALLAGSSAASADSEHDDGVDDGISDARATNGVELPLCSDSIALMALQRISEAQQHYSALGFWYEANLTQALLYQVRSAMALSAGRLQVRRLHGGGGRSWGAI